MDVSSLDREEFLDELAVRTTAADIFFNAPEIYDYLSAIFGQNCNDSLLREWSFQYYCEVTGDDYNAIYNRWLGDK